MNRIQYRIEFTHGTLNKVWEAFCVNDHDSKKRFYAIFTENEGYHVDHGLFDRDDDDEKILEDAVLKLPESYTNIVISEI